MYKVVMLDYQFFLPPHFGSTKKYDSTINKCDSMMN